MPDERVMVMERDHFEGGPSFFSWTEARQVLHAAWSSAQWFPRPEAETSERWVQPIPCGILQDRWGQYAIFRRSPAARNDLSNKMSLMIGGHIEPMPGHTQGLRSSLLSTLRRELIEEVDVHAPSIREPLGLVIDRKSTRASRHIALVYRIAVQEDINVVAGEEFVPQSALSGRFLPKEVLLESDFQYDPWSNLVLRML